MYFMMNVFTNIFFLFMENIKFSTCIILCYIVNRDIHNKCNYYFENFIVFEETLN